MARALACGHGLLRKSRAWVEVVVSSLSEAEAKPAGASNAARIGSGEFLLFFTIRFGEGNCCPPRSLPTWVSIHRKRRAWHPGFVLRKAVEAGSAREDGFRDRLLFLFRGLAAGGLTIGVTEHDRTVKIFEFPTPLDE